ncbi:aminodeoxychorismate synthase component I [Shewanella corallii]|uniref:aminodeoxychorismate synthase n=1 Tax=Shewanella corallii TaxID=560080 RepID=A0ABT0N6G3_9GAMM|nr:aminodeoxychorismate synthase component I [Shewanella corallii]MCL2914009.1 aminodeoxychorismate synthase component I [Shewanella corallii]
MDPAASATPAFCQLDWTIDTESLFSRLAARPWSVLLDSAGATHMDARYDIICADPVATLTHSNGINKLEFVKGQVFESNNEDPFQLINATLKQLFGEPGACELPFSGGAMGAFGYDLGRSIEKLPATAHRDIDLPDLNLGFYDWALIRDYQKQAWFLVHARGQQALEAQQRQLETLLSQSAPAEAPFALEGDWHSQISKQAYLDKFDAVQEYLHSGDCYQINLTQRFECNYTGDEWQAYLKLRHSNSAPFSAFMRLPQQAVLSISPERFIKLESGKIETKPIKGTLPRYADPTEDQAAAKQLANSPKDRAENLMIVDLLRNDIGKVAAPGSVSVPKLFDVESFPAVHHLVSTVTATLNQGNEATHLLRAAFPGGSITGAPKIRAMEIIEELEPSRRNLYCGSMGYISQDGKMDTSITIRTLVAEKGKLYCWAGGGIVADSNGDCEYQETFDKVSRILPILKSQ